MIRLLPLALLTCCVSAWAQPASGATPQARNLIPLQWSETCVATRVQPEGAPASWAGQAQAELRRTADQASVRLGEDCRYVIAFDFEFDNDSAPGLYAATLEVYGLDQSVGGLPGRTVIIWQQRRWGGSPRTYSSAALQSLFKRTLSELARQLGTDLASFDDQEVTAWLRLPEYAAN